MAQWVEALAAKPENMTENQFLQFVLSCTHWINVTKYVLQEYIIHTLAEFLQLKKDKRQNQSQK